MLNVPNNIIHKENTEDFEEEYSINYQDEELEENEEIFTKPNEEDDLNNYKGYYFNEETEEKYFEGGSHFRYKDLCSRLEKLIKIVNPICKGGVKEKKENFEELNPISNFQNFNEKIEKFKKDSHINNGNYKKKIVTKYKECGDSAIINNENLELIKNSGFEIFKNQIASRKINSNDCKIKSHSNNNNNQAANLTITKNVFKDLKNLRDKTKTIKKIHVGVELQNLQGVSSNFSMGSGVTTTKNFTKKENTFSNINLNELNLITRDNNKETPTHLKLNSNSNNSGNAIFIKLKPNLVIKQNSLKTKGSINKGKYIDLRVSEKKINNTKIHKSKIIINSTLLKNKSILNNSDINKMPSFNQIGNSFANKNNIIISKTSSIINELNKISFLNKSRNFSNTKGCEIIGNVNTKNTNLLSNNNLGGNKLTYSDTKASIMIHNYKDRENNRNKVLVTNNEININNNFNQITNANSSSQLLNSLDVKFETTIYNKSRNTHRNLPDKSEASKNHTTTDNKTVNANTHDSIISNFLSATMKNDPNLTLNNINSFHSIMPVNNKIINNTMLKESKDFNKESENINLDTSPVKPKIINEKFNNIMSKQLTVSKSIKNLPQFLIKNTSNDTSKINKQSFSNIIGTSTNKRILLNRKKLYFINF